MKQVFSIVGAAFLSLALLVTSCKKGDTGPEGPEGPAGPAGPGGPAGPAGTANVIYSNWINVGFEEAYDTLSNGTIDTFYVGGMDAPKITLDILNKGDIRVYWNSRTTDQNPVIFALPFSEAGLEVVPRFGVGGIGIISTADLSTLQNQQGTIFLNQFRYVIIPGGTAARSNINWNNYADVKEKLNLPD